VDDRPVSGLENEPSGWFIAEGRFSLINICFFSKFVYIYKRMATRYRVRAERKNATQGGGVMGSHKYLSLLSGAVLLFSVTAASAQPSWQSLGLADRSTNCILADDTTMVLAGTDSGMSVYWNKRWYDFSLTLPVTSIVRLSDNIIFVGAGNGSRSDAVYIGKKIILGPPFYALRLQQYFVEPTAMTINNTMAIPRLYAGGLNRVSVAMIGADTLYPFDTVKIPAYAFGTEMPHCADLLLFGDTTLYAGGYDQSIMMGSPGNLLVLVKDSLGVARKLDVTALAEGTFLEVGPLELVVGTRDSGVWFYSPSMFIPWTNIPGPNKEPVKDLLTMPGMMFSDMLVAAANSGVFTSGSHSSEWTEVGDIPAPPNCLAVRGRATGSMEGSLMAGTSKGVYLYATTVGIRDRQMPSTAAIAARPVLCRNGEILLRVPAAAGRAAEIAVYTMSGKLYARVSTAQSTVRFRLEAAGLYYYFCTVSGRTEQSGVLINVR
jgi:hypothetical protein